MDYTTYPKDWKARVSRILARAKHRCEHCRVANYAVGRRPKKELTAQGKLIKELETENARLNRIIRNLVKRWK